MIRSSRSARRHAGRLIRSNALAWLRLGPMARSSRPALPHVGRLIRSNALVWPRLSPVAHSSRPALPHVGPLLVLVLGVIAFEALQFTANATIHWDAVDVHYASQAYFADQLHSGRLPLWTTALFSGFPFLADPQVGAWYPLNWPFFLAGVTPRSIQLELAVHVLVACIGGYVLAWRLLRDRHGALFSGLFFGLSGYFAGHAEHVGMLQTAAWLPWLLLGVLSLSDCLTARRVACLGVLGGSIVLAGHFQAALFDFSAMLLFACWQILEDRGRWRRLTLGLATAALITLGLCAVIWLPGLELARESIRARLDASTNTFGLFRPEGLLTLVWPNALGALFGSYAGPTDMSQYYWYAGLLCIPFAVVGALAGPLRVRLAAGVLIVPFCWYAAGPSAGLYPLLSRVPGFSNIQGPINGWFVAALGLALLAGSGWSRIAARVGWLTRWLPLVVLLLIGDVTFWNSAVNRLAFERASADELYLAPVASLRAEVEQSGPPPVRLAGQPLTRVGYLNQTLQVGAESTYGYNPLELGRYQEYMLAAESNSRLVDTLAATQVVAVDPLTDVVSLVANPTAMHLASLPSEVIAVADPAAEVAALRTLDPAQAVLVVTPAPLAVQPPGATDHVTVLAREQEHVLLDYAAAAPVLVRLATPSYPGWHATLNGTELPLLTVDHALLGIVAPAGQGTISVEYRSTTFAIGAAISAATLALVLICLALVQAATEHSQR
jgi:hypothetical protein